MLIKTDALTRLYGSQRSVDSVSMHIDEGDIYGLIGRNGAGKTTLMRLLVGTARTNGGNVSFGGDLTPSSIGSLIENPGLFSGETARENLLRYMVAFGHEKPDVAEADRLLRLVNLDPASKKKAKQFSLGMKQRLGIAIALIGNPKLLILDEPVNGLDPIGMREIREIVVSLNREGISFLISSHLLDELSKIATKYGIMDGGKLLEETPAGDLSRKCENAYRVARSALPADMGALAEIEHLNDGDFTYFFPADGDENAKAAIASLTSGESEAVRTPISIEEYFSMKVGGKSE